jgi:ribosomal protein L3 glutamine methyltransferase
VAQARPAGLYRQARAQLATVRDLLRFAVSRFTQAQLAFGHGTSNAHDEAAFLILHTLHLPLEALERYLDARLCRDEIAEVVAIVERRIGERLPAAYLTGEAWLGEFRFYVDQRAIVPRSYIAELLREQLHPWVANPGAVRSVLDLCCGSACLAILAAHAFPNASIDATDVSEQALQVARRNVADYELKQRVSLLRSDLFAALRGRRYELILANPPYVPAASMRALPEEYRHEPPRALAGGKDGLDFVRKIVQQAAEYLEPDGLLLMETGHYRPTVEAAFPRLDCTWLETSAGDDCVLLLRRAQLLPADHA